VLGFADDVGCQVSQTETGPALNVSVDACNVTQNTSEAGEVTFAVTIAPPGSGTQGALILTSDILLQCSCTLGVAATSGSGALMEDVDDPQDVSASGEVAFEVSPVESFADSAYQEASLNGSLSEVDGRYYFQVASTDVDVIVGLQECSASPTSDPTDPSSVAFLEDFCPVGELLVQRHASGSHEARFSTRAFKFSMMPDVHISCTVVRCASQPCGACAGSRRLAPRRASGAAASSTSASAFLLRPPDAGAVYYYLPTAPTLSRSVSTPDAAGDDYGSTVTEVETMISNVPAVVASDIATFSSVFASAVSEYLIVPLDTVEVLSVNVTMAEGMGSVRRLDVDPPGTIEAMLVQTLVTGLAWEGARSDEFDGSAPNFTGVLKSMLEASFSVDMGDISLLVAKQLLIAEPAGAVAHAREQDRSSSVAMTLAWACGAASGLVLLLGFAAFARCLLCRLHRSSPGATEKADVEAGQVNHGQIIHL